MISSFSILYLQAVAAAECTRKENTMVKFDSREAFIFETTIRAIDLIKIANQLYQDKMQYVKLGIDYSNDIEKNGSVQIYAIPSATSEDVKKYPVIEPITSVDIDTFLAD